MEVFHDPEVQRALEAFVPVAQDVQYTQYRRVDDEQTRFFAQLMKQVRNFNGSKEGTTRQGFYAFDATGHVYGAMNSRSRGRLLRLLSRAKSEFEAAPPAKIELPATPPYARPKPPEDGAVLQVFARIGPLSAEQESHRRGRRGRWRGSRNARLGRDYLWVRSNELATLARGRMPNALGGRLLVNHFLDNIRGEPDPWELEHVERAKFDVTTERRVDPVGRATIEVKIDGAFRLHSEQRDVGGKYPLPDSGFEGRLEARLVFEDDRETLKSWVMIAEGEAWGRSRYTNGQPSGRFPLRIAFRHVTEPYHREVPPGMYFRGAGAYWDPGVRLPIDSI